MKKIVAAIASLMLLSCTTKKETAANTAPAEKGIAVGSITFEGNVPRNDIYRFFYTSLAQDKKFRKANSGRIEIKAREGNTRAFTGDLNDKKTYLFVIEQQPGSYAFTQYNYLDHIGYSGMVSSSKKFAIPFEIKKDSIAYLGELVYNDDAQPGSPRIKVRDNYKRDVQALKIKEPALKTDTISNKTVKSGDNGNGIVEF